MTIKDIELDNLSKSEYFHLLKTLVEYFYVQFGEELKIVQGSEKE